MLVSRHIPEPELHLDGNREHDRERNVAIPRQKTAHARNVTNHARRVIGRESDVGADGSLARAIARSAARATTWNALVRSLGGGMSDEPSTRVIATLMREIELYLAFWELVRAECPAPPDDESR